MPRSKPPTRIFISYSRKDEALVSSLERLLRSNGFAPMRDRHFAFGVGFQDQIRRFIEHAHIFMPVVTKESSNRGWVHQEIGYAIAQNIPVLPVTVGKDPGEWIQSLQAVNLSTKEANSNLSHLQHVLSHRRIETLVRSYRDEQFATYSCARFQEDRAAMITSYCEGVETIQLSLAAASKKPGPPDCLSSLVRQSGALTSFHIPDRPINDPVWIQRYASQPKSEHHCRLQREERRALTRHAKRHGYRLIIEPSITFESPEMRRVRLECLLDFLHEPMDQGVTREIVVKAKSDDEKKKGRLPETENITIVGNWFFAIAITAKRGRGYNQTIFTRHAPSMQVHIEQFDEQFDAHLGRLGWTRKNCREKTISTLEKILKKL